MDRVIDVVESFKAKLTDQEYIDLMDALKTYHSKENIIPEKILTRSGKTINASCHGNEYAHIISFDMDHKNIVQLRVLDRSAGDFNENEYEVEVDLDDDVTITASNNDWTVETSDDIYRRSKIPMEPCDGSYGYRISDQSGEKHSIMGMPSEVWYRSDGSCKIENWHHRGKCVTEKEHPRYETET